MQSNVIGTTMPVLEFILEPNEVIMATRSGAGLRSGVRLAGIEPATLRSGGARSIP